MTIEVGHLIAVLGVAWSVVGTLAGLVYRELRSQIEDKDKRIATLESSAAEAVRAKDEEIKEWRRYAHAALPGGQR